MSPDSATKDYNKDTRIWLHVSRWQEETVKTAETWKQM